LCLHFPSRWLFGVETDSSFSSECMNVEISALMVLAFAAFGLLIAVSFGIVYLTAVEWRDRRRREREQREQRGR